MARVILITGGCRSGKSAYALRRAEALPGRRLFIATCPALDDEMRARIRRHQEARAAKGWDTVEEEVDLAAAIGRAHGHQVALVDCLTLWINNVMYHEDRPGREIGEDDIAARARTVLDACARHPGTVIFVTNEVGMGIVPENALVRRYRDLAGRCNQVIGAGAAEVVLVVCGSPLTVKGNV